MRLPDENGGKDIGGRHLTTSGVGDHNVTTKNDLGGQGETTGRGATRCTPQAHSRGGKETGNEGPRHEECVLGMQSVQGG